MKNHNQEEFNKINEDEKIKMILTDIQSAIDSKDEQQINNYIKQIALNIKKLMSAANQDKVSYIIIQILNKIVATSPTMRTEACEILHESINRGLEEIEFEKKSLLELKKYLSNCKKSKEYNNLPLSFGILLYLLIMQNDRTEKLKIDADIWKCGLSGIRYIPAVSTDSQTNQLRESIEEGLKRIRK